MLTPMRRSALVFLGLFTSSAALAAPSLDVKDGIATIAVPRNLVEGAPTVQLTMEMPAGWKRWEETSTSGVMLVPETARYGRPSMVKYCCPLLLASTRRVSPAGMASGE